MRKTRLIPLFLFVVAGVIIFTLSHFDNKKKYQKLLSEYQLMSKQEPIRGVIINIFDVKSIGFRESGLASFVTINSKKYLIYGEDNNSSYKHGINEIISIGDSILKETNSNELLLKKSDGTKYLFIRKDTEF